ncbi:hypothetical protein EC912_1111 [Luteibacter rhizovicinus]|uniref:Uncharacterized protein n=1 Tax=Luteibacter rhizovicinus TaxID=242606 RepID=A0A4R3YJ71_9GAMM|nr:hypothetical protein EC912_1111 [Luteibacter rhizovicinus]
MSNGEEAKQVTDEYQRKFESLRPLLPAAVPRVGGSTPVQTLPARP